MIQANVGANKFYCCMTKTLPKIVAETFGKIVPKVDQTKNYSVSFEMNY